MVVASGGPTATRRRRSDANRSVEAIVDAAGGVLAERPDATMEEIAALAGVSRQTVYAHFASRDALVDAVIDRAGADFLAELDGAHLDTLAPPDELAGFLEIGWEYLRRYLPLLLNSTVSHPPRVDGDDAQHPVTKLLEQIIRRGRRNGDFDRALPTTWLADAILRLGHSAAEHVASGRLSAPRAAAMLRESALRLCGASATR